MYSNIELINEAALEELNQNKIYRAQTLFRQNVKENSCFITLNNLGVFHVFEGLLKPDNSRRGATKLGISYLKKAAIYQKSELTLRTLGKVYFEAREYKEAGESFRLACELKPDYASLYNLAVSRYKQRMYEDSTTWFKKSLDLCEASGYADTYIAYAFSLLHCDQQQCLGALHKLLKYDISHLEMDLFILAYLCNDLLEAEKQIKSMFDHWSVDIPIMAMIFDCLFKLGKDGEAKEYLKYKIESLEGYDYNIKVEINQTKKAFSSSDYRKKLIDHYHYEMPLIQQCCYYGCKQHNPL